MKLPTVTKIADHFGLPAYKAAFIYDILATVDIDGLKDTYLDVKQRRLQPLNLDYQQEVALKMQIIAGRLGASYRLVNGKHIVQVGADPKVLTHKDERFKLADLTPWRIKYDARTTRKVPSVRH